MLIWWDGYSLEFMGSCRAAEGGACPWAENTAVPVGPAMDAGPARHLSQDPAAMEAAESVGCSDSSSFLVDVGAVGWVGLIGLSRAD